MTSAYALRSSVFFTNASFGLGLFRDAPSDDRKKSIDFHVESDDYFGTLATILGLIADSSQFTNAKKDMIDLRDELVYLQERYTIKRKAK